MCFKSFFKYTDGFTAISGVVALLLGSYALFKRFIEKANVELSIGDTLYFVRTASFNIEKIQLTCNFINKSNKSGVINKMMLKLFQTDKPNNLTELDWDIFYKYARGELGERQAKYESETYPIIVKGRDSNFQAIEFIVNNIKIIDLKKGSYTINVLGWVNQTDINKKPNINEDIFITLEERDIEKINSREKQGPVFIPIQVNKWKIS